ncbi:MAG: SPOR domain-containing protein [Pseudomonadota bacterium]
MNGVWRLAWVVGVFGLFTLVVGTAFTRAPAPSGAVPVVAADPLPIKERVELPPLETAVPRSSVLNLLAEGDDPDRAREAADLEAAKGMDAAKQSQVAELEAALAAIAPGEGLPSDALPGEDLPGVGTLLPAAEPGPTASAPVDGPDATATTTASLLEGGFRIQLAAVKPGDEHAAFEALQRRFAPALADLGPRFQAVTTDGGVLVRVQAGPIESHDDATARCTHVRERGGDCLVVSVSG